MGETYCFTGYGEGKTTAALGHALRALGHGKKVVVIQFLKGWKNTGEYNFKSRNFELKLFGRPQFVTKKKKHKFKYKSKKVYADEIKKQDTKLASEALGYARRAIKKKTFLVVLDEVNVALYFKLVKLQDVLRLLKNLPEETNLILTGRNAPKALMRACDVVTIMRPVKAPGVAVPGMEY